MTSRRGPFRPRLASSVDQVRSRSSPRTKSASRTSHRRSSAGRSAREGLADDGERGRQVEVVVEGGHEPLVERPAALRTGEPPGRGPGPSAPARSRRRCRRRARRSRSAGRRRARPQRRRRGPRSVSRRRAERGETAPGARPARGRGPRATHRCTRACGGSGRSGRDSGTRADRCPRAATSAIRSMLPADFAIFRPPTWRNSPWTQTRAGGPPTIGADWAISSSWWGKTLSMPPLWTSNRGAEVPQGHRRALEVPAGEALAPARGRPLQLAALAGRLPEGEVRSVALVRLDLAAMARPERVERVARTGRRRPGTTPPRSRRCRSSLT